MVPYRVHYMLLGAVALLWVWLLYVCSQESQVAIISPATAALGYTIVLGVYAFITTIVFRWVRRSATYTALAYIACVPLSPVAIYIVSNYREFARDFIDMFNTPVKEPNYGQCADIERWWYRWADDGIVEVAVVVRTEQGGPIAFEPRFNGLMIQREENAPVSLTASPGGAIEMRIRGRVPGEENQAPDRLLFKCEHGNALFWESIKERSVTPQSAQGPPPPPVPAPPLL